MSQLSARDIRDRLAAQVHSVAEHLLGRDGKREGHELRFGSINGEPGKSLGIHLSGERAGVWSDFATGDAGDLLDLWCAVKRCDMGTALAEAKDYLGIRDVRIDIAKPKPIAPLHRPDGVRPLSTAAMHWLRDVRKLSAEAIAAYKLAQSGERIAMPFLLPDTTLVALKYRSFPADEYAAEKGGAKALFGWQAIPPTARTVVLCEGELKALAWWDFGFPALSVPFGGGGGGKQDWIETEYDRLARFDTIYLAMDEDEAGKAAAAVIMDRLGVERCAVVRHPLPAEPGSKCINACLKHGVSRAAVAAAIKAARPRDPAELRSAAEYAEDLRALFDQQRKTGEIGIRTPWKKIGNELVFRPGELTVIAGYTGHGKSQAVGFMTCYAIMHGTKVCVASLEFRVTAWLKRLIKQLTAQSELTVDYAMRIAQWCGGKLWAFDAQGTANLDRMIDVFRYARRRYNVSLFVVDNLTGLGIAEDDYQGQKMVALSLSNFARDEDVHVWLVHHARKGDESRQPGKTEFKGSGGITDLASTVLSVWRNKSKEDQIAEQKSIKCEQPSELNARDAKLAELAQMPDVRISCSKQRNYEGPENGEPRIALWWGGGCFHYLAKPDHRPRPFVTLDAPQTPPDDGVPM